MSLHPAQTIALIRIGLGLEFLIWSWDKLHQGWLTSGAQLVQTVSGAVERAAGPYAGFLEEVVVPNAGLFAQFVTIGEIGAGISLCLGLLTRLGAATGMWLALNFMLMRGVLGVEASIDRVFFLGCAACLLTSAGRVWGLDGWLRDLTRASGGERSASAEVGAVPRRVVVPLLRVAEKLQ